MRCAAIRAGLCAALAVGAAGLSVRAQAQAQVQAQAQAPPGENPAGGATPGAAPVSRHRLRERFAAANSAHDGRLTLDQAQVAGMRGVVRNFATIDTGGKGYVTLDDIRAFHRARHASAGAPR